MRVVGDDRIVGLEAEAVAALAACWDRASAAPPIRPSTRSRRCRSARSLVAAVTSFRNAPTLTSTKQAKAISARLSTDRAGRTDVWRRPSGTSPAGRGRAWLDERRRRRQDRRRAESADEPRAAGAEEARGGDRSRRRARRRAGPRPVTISSAGDDLRGHRGARRVRVSVSPFSSERADRRRHRANAEPDRQRCRRRARRRRRSPATAGATCSASSVVPTAPTHQVRRPYMIAAP